MLLTLTAACGTDQPTVLLERLSAPTSGEKLLHDASARQALFPDRAPTESQALALDRILSDPAVGEVWLVRVNHEMLAGTEVEMSSLEAEAAAPLANQHYARRDELEAVTWRAEVADGGQAALVVRDGGASGLLTIDDRLYSLRPLGDDLHLLFTLRDAELPPDHAGSEDGA